MIFIIHFLHMQVLIIPQTEFHSMDVLSEIRSKSGKKIVLRFPEKNDLEKLVEMYTTLSDRTMMYLRPYRFTKKEVEVMLGRVDFRNVFSIVAEDEHGKIVGEVRLITHETGSGEIGIIVHDSYQNQGIGQRLLKEIIKLAKEKEIKKLISFINEKNNPALHIFRKEGFTVEKRFPPSMNLMGREESVVKLSLNLTK